MSRKPCGRETNTLQDDRALGGPYAATAVRRSFETTLGRISRDFSTSAALLKRLPQLRVHSVLGKWLYISQTHADFEAVALEVAEMARRRDPLLGVEPKPRKRSAKRSTS